MISKMDFIYTLARYKLNSFTNTFAPRFEHRLVLDNSSHPILEHLNRQKKAQTQGKFQPDNPGFRSVTNNIKASESKPFVVITGSNMSGKYIVWCVQNVITLRVV